MEVFIVRTVLLGNLKIGVLLTGLLVLFCGLLQNLWFFLFCSRLSACMGFEFGCSYSVLMFDS